MEYKILESGNIEVEVDPRYDSSYGGDYCAEFSKEELLELLNAIEEKETNT